MNFLHSVILSVKGYFYVAPSIYLAPYLASPLKVLHKSDTKYRSLSHLLKYYDRKCIYIYIYFCVSCNAAILFVFSLDD